MDAAAHHWQCPAWSAGREDARGEHFSRSAVCMGTPVSDTRVQNQIRHWRLLHGELTQEQLAKRCDVTRQTIIALEAGKYSPSLELAFRLARALGRDLEEVFQFSEE